MTQVIACALQLGGMPVPKGGGVQLVERARGHRARRRRRAPHGRRGRARSSSRRDARPRCGSRTARPSRRERAVVASVTPTQLYGRPPRRGRRRPTASRARRARYRYGRGEMQIHLALREPPDWYGDERLARTAIVHVTPGLDGVSRAVNEAERGLLPAEATIVCGQPVAVDPSRAPEGSLDPLDPAPGAAGRARQGRRRRRARRRRRDLDGEAARGLRGPHRRAPRTARPEPRARDAGARRPLPRRHRGAERQPRRRGHLRRLLRARPELPLPPAAAGAGPPDAGRRPLAHRRLDAPGARARRRLRATSSTRS